MLSLNCPLERFKFVGHCRVETAGERQIKLNITLPNNGINNMCFHQTQPKNNISCWKGPFPNW